MERRIKSRTFVLNALPKKEEYAWILDYLPYGSTIDRIPTRQKKPICQAIGEEHFILMELIPKENIDINIDSRVYIGDGKRKEIEHVKRVLKYNDLSSGAKLELPYIIENCIKHSESKFIKFFNEAHSISIKLHMLQLLPGIGNKLMKAILKERNKKDFKNFKELNERVNGLHSPEKVVVDRVIEELKDANIKYRLFTLPTRMKKS